MDTLFEAHFSPLASTGKLLSKCGKCLRYMRYIDMLPKRLYCQNCECTYKLPQNGTIKLYKELKCPLDNFELLLFSLGNVTGHLGKTYPLCPCCYNTPPDFHSIADGGYNDDGESDGANGPLDMGCNQCAHPTCRHGMAYNAVADCPNVDADNQPCGGMLVLDVNSRPNWKLCCNNPG